MGAKVDRAKKYKEEMNRKWEQKQRDSGLTKEDLEQMEKENLIYKKLAHEATLEWLAEKGYK